MRPRAEMVPQSLGGKNNQMHTSIDRESYTSEPKVQPEVFVVKFSQHISSPSWLAFSSIASSYYDLKPANSKSTTVLKSH